MVKTTESSLPGLAGLAELAGLALKALHFSLSSRFHA